MTRHLSKCASCGVPAIECFGGGVHRHSLHTSQKVWLLEDGQSTDSNPYRSEWCCEACKAESNLHCSHCDEVLEDSSMSSSPPVLLDDGSFLCKMCGTKLKEELDEFTSNQ